MHEFTKTCVPSIFSGILVVLAACQKIPEPVPEVPVPAAEEKIRDKILSLAGEVGERDPNTGHITIVILEGDKVDSKMLDELSSLKKLEILELRNLAKKEKTKLKKAIAKLEKELPKLELVYTDNSSRGKGGDDKKKKKK